MTDPLTNYPATACVNPYTQLPQKQPVSPQNPTPDFTSHRGGFQQIGTASPNNGGGAVFVFITDGAVLQFGADGTGKPVTVPPAYDSTYQIRYNPGSSSYITQPGYDWIKDTGGNPPSFTYSCYPLTPGA